MNPLNEQQLSRLQTSIEWSNRQLEFPRRKRVEAIKQYVGSHYSDGGAEKRVPVNMLALSVLIYVRQLAARAPRVMISTKREDLKSTAANLELAINQIPDEIGLGLTFRRLVTEAMFSLGIVKVGLHTVSEALGHKYGAPFVDVITLDDYFMDASAKRRDLISYEGNDYWLDYEELMDSGWVEKDKRADLKPDEYTVIGPAGEDRAEGIASDESAQLYKDRIWLRDVWLPDERLVVTYGVKSKKLLKTVEWDGPDHGPYYTLGFADVPGNLLPLPPGALWRDLHELGNALFRKLANQADSQKTVHGFSGGNEESVEVFKKAGDGDGIRYTGQPPVELKTGGVEQTTLAFYLQTRNLYSYFAGNIDSVGGLAPMTQTVGQDRLIGEAASAQLRDMAGSVMVVAREIFSALAWYEWHDPIGRRTLEKPVPGTKLSIPVEWGRESKLGSFSLYDLDIDPYSLQDDSPGLKLQKLGMVVNQYVLPLAPLIQQAGGEIDVQAILKLVGQYADLPEIGEIVTFVEPPANQTPDQLPMPAHTTRTYERVGRPGKTQQGADTEMQQLLLSKDLQDSGA